MKNFVAAVAVLLAGFTASAADLSGTWKVEGDVMGNALNFTCALKQDGEALSGTATVEGQSLAVKGNVTDRAVTFQFDVAYNGTTYTNVFTGTLGEDGVIKGTIAVAGVDGTFTATRQ